MSSNPFKPTKPKLSFWEWDANIFKAFREPAFTPERRAELFKEPPHPLENIPDEQRFRHTHIVGSSGHGKTNLLRFLISRDLERVAAGGASVVIIDSQEELIPELARLKQFAPGEPLDGKLVYLDPNDIDHPFALSLFDIGTKDRAKLSPLEREKLANASVDLINYVFDALLETTLSDQMRTLIQFSVDAALALGNITLLDIYDLLEPAGKGKDGKPAGWQQYDARLLASLDTVPKIFYEREFKGITYDSTKEALKRRFMSLLRVAVFRRMFSYSSSRFDLFEQINQGKVILINTAQSLLSHSLEVFGRFFIALVGMAAERRAGMHGGKLPTFVYIDEAWQYLKSDAKFERILIAARKQHIGVTIAHTKLGDFLQPMQQALASNASTRIIGGVSDQDAFNLSKNMGQTKAGFINEQPRFTFAYHYRSEPTARAMSIPLVDFNTMPQMWDEEFAVVRQSIRDEFCATEEERPEDKPPPEPEDEPTEPPTDPTMPSPKGEF